MSLGLSWLGVHTSRHGDHLEWSSEMIQSHSPEWETHKIRSPAGSEFKQHRCQKHRLLAWSPCLWRPGSANNKMGDNIARKFFCQDVQSPTGNGTLIVLSLFNLRSAMGLFLIISWFEPCPQHYASKHFIADWLKILRISFPSNWNLLDLQIWKRNFHLWPGDG